MGEAVHEKETIQSLRVDFCVPGVARRFEDELVDFQCHVIDTLTC